MKDRDKDNSAKTLEPHCDLVKDHSKQTKYVRLQGSLLPASLKDTGEGNVKKDERKTR